MSKNIDYFFVPHYNKAVANNGRNDSNGQVIMVPKSHGFQ